MHFRKQFGAAALLATAALAGCDGRDEPGGDPQDAGCTGVCSTPDSGTDAGANNCPAAVDGVGPIGQLRATGTRGQPTKLEGLVVVDVTNTFKGSQGDWIAQFWVAHPCFPTEGIYVDKFYTDAVKNYEPKVGDVVTVEGLFRRYTANASDTDSGNKRFREAYRPVIKSSFALGVPGATGNLVITKTGEVARLADNAVPSGFGDAKGGTVQANPGFAGSRVHIPGPITITNAKPLALKARPEEPTHEQYFGFEVNGGILVNNHKTFAACDYRAAVMDGGTVTFPNGIRGVWDTYTHVPCTDGGTQTSSDGGTFFRCDVYGDGKVPGTEQPYTHVLYPQNCHTDLDAGQ
jgi:hypothetical protein